MKAAVEERRLPAVPGFQLVRRVGRGGMGEVFHAVRLGPRGFRKAVALKQLIADQALSGRARQRFFEEAQLSAQLEHPNLVRIHDVVEADGAYFIVMEMLRGVNLVELVADQDASLAWPLCLSILAQALDGLAYAHAAVDERGHPLGLVHRDLTPRNLFVCVGGGVKILDFGIAKRRGGPSLTGSGHVQGTIELLSPEQARGERVDQRSDLYQLGATLYWMLAGRYPYGDGTVGEIIARAAAGRPEPIAGLVSDLPASVVAIVERAMARAPEERFPDALAMGAAVRAALEAAPHDERGPVALARSVPIEPGSPVVDDAPSHTISATGETTAATPGSAHEPARATDPRARPWRSRWPWVAASTLVLSAIGFIAGHASSDRDPAAPSAPPSWMPITFGGARIGGARFAPDGKTFIYGRAGRDGRMSLHQSTTGNTVGRPLGIDDADVLAISRGGDILVLRSAIPDQLARIGTLAIAPLAGGAPRELLTDVTFADFGIDGRTIAVGRSTRGRRWIEYPIGQVLVESRTAWYSSLRVSPDGTRLVFVEHAANGDDRGVVTVIGPDRVARRIGPTWDSIDGLGWNPDRDELWLTGALGPTGRQVIAMTLDGRHRALARVPVRVRLADITRGGRALVLTEVVRGEASANVNEHLEPLPRVGDIEFVQMTVDGRWWIGANFAGDEYQVFKMPVDRSAQPARLGDGLSRGPSPDGKWVLTVSGTRDRMKVFPIGAGAMLDLSLGGVKDLSGSSWFPDSQRVLFSATTSAGAEQIHIIDLAGGPPRAIGRPGLQLPMTLGEKVSAGSKVLVTDTATGKPVLLSVADGSDQPALGVEPHELGFGWSPDSTEVIVGGIGGPLSLFRVNIRTGARVPWKLMTPSRPETLVFAVPTWISPDLSRYILGEVHLICELFLVEGLE